MLEIFLEPAPIERLLRTNGVIDADIVAVSIAWSRGLLEVVGTRDAQIGKRAVIIREQ